MRKIAQIIPFLLFITLTQSALQAQVRVRDNSQPEAKESSSFASHLWYGGNVGLGYSGGSYASLFQIGVSPMVGYKIFEPFSIGPRVSITYSAYRENYTGSVQKANTVSWSVGAFARYKIIRSIFLHTEAELENTPIYTSAKGKLEVLRRQRNNFYLGGGYNSSAGLFGYEILLLYNLNQPDNDVQSPFNIRFGFTYNF